MAFSLTVSPAVITVNTGRLFVSMKNFAGLEVLMRQGIRNPQTRFEWIG